jgi:queuine tRNA-ribosyltransferase
MQTNTISQFAPILTTEAGSCLTIQNWKETGVEAVVYELSALLVKPGMTLLKTLPDLASYTGWDKTLLLDASMLKMNRDGRVIIHSSYDGSRQSYTTDELWSVMVQLKPHGVILPAGFDAAGHGLPDMTGLFMASDQPARDACDGIVYGKNGNIDIKATECRLDFRMIDETCQCPTCHQSFTRAYLHHLLEHTPLLCQRLLIQHNVHFLTMAPRITS